MVQGPKSKKLKALQAVWYKKLKDTGFEDIEDTSNDQEFLKSWHSSYFQVRNTPDEFEAHREYYSMAGKFLEDQFKGQQYDIFKKNPSGVVWELHSEGLSIRNIAKNLGMKECQVFQIIRTLKNKMLGRK